LKRRYYARFVLGLINRGANSLSHQNMTADISNKFGAVKGYGTIISAMNVVFSRHLVVRKEYKGMVNACLPHLLKGFPETNQIATALCNHHRLVGRILAAQGLIRPSRWHIRKKIFITDHVLQSHHIMQADPR